MLNQSSNAFSLRSGGSSNVISLDKERVKKYNPQAAFYALPKAFINRLLFQISGSTLKVFIALVNHTDCWNIIRYPGKITHSSLMKTTGIKKKETISKAYKELCDLSIIGGYAHGHGSENTKFYFTFDIDHYKTEECCLELDEISSYYEMLLSGKFSEPVPELPDAAENSEDDNIRCTAEECDPSREIPLNSEPVPPEPGSGHLKYIATIANSWSGELKLYQDNNTDVYLLEDGSVFCDKEEFIKDYQHCIVSKPDNKMEDNYSPFSFDSDNVNNEIPPEVAENGTPSPLFLVQESTKKKDSLNTIKSYKINNLIVMFQKDFKFIHEFNDFCTDDSPKNLKNTLFWIAKNAAGFDLSLGEVIESLSVANDKGKQGSMCYLIGIMRNKAGNKASGVKVITKPLFVQVKEYFAERFSHSLEYLNSYSIDWNSKELRYTLKNPENDRDPMSEFFKFVVSDIKKSVGVSLSHVEVA